MDDKEHREKIPAEIAGKSNPDDESDRERRKLYARKIIDAEKKSLENARDIPPELFKTMDNPASTLDEV